MEKLRQGRVLLFIVLIIVIYRLTRSQDLATPTMLSEDICEDTEWFASCQRIIPPFPQLHCVPPCPTAWIGNAQRVDYMAGRRMGQSLRQWFKATAAWNGTNIMCNGEKGSKRVIIGGRPKVHLKFANKIMWIGLNQTSSCAVDLPCSVPPVNSVDWIRQCVDPMGCAYQVVQHTNATITVKFNSTKAWNNSVVICSMATRGLALREQRILDVYAHPVLTSLPADDYFLEEVNVTLSCVTVEYLPPSIDLALHWYCATSCPGDFNKSGPGKITFKATSAWNGILMKCDSEVGLPIALNTVKRMINVITDVQVFINLKSISTLHGELQLVNCSLIGLYWHVVASHPIQLTVMCPGGGCNYTTKKIQSFKESGENLLEESGEFSVKFVADATWNGALVICKLRDSFLPKHQARLIINFTGTPTTEKSFKDNSSTMTSMNTSPSDDVATRPAGLKTTMLVLAFSAGTAVVFAAVLLPRTCMLVLWHLKCRCFGHPVGPSDDSSDEAHSIHQSQSPTSPGNLGLVAETTL